MSFYEYIQEKYKPSKITDFHVSSLGGDWEFWLFHGQKLPILRRVAVVSPGPVKDYRSNGNINCFLINNQDNHIITEDLKGPKVAFERLAEIEDDEDVYWFLIYCLFSELIGSQYRPGMIGLYKRVFHVLSDDDIKYAETVFTELYEYFQCRGLWHSSCKCYVPHYFPNNIIDNDSIATLLKSNFSYFKRLALLSSAMWLNYYSVGYVVDENCNLYEHRFGRIQDISWFPAIKPKITHYYKLSGNMVIPVKPKIVN